MNSLLTCIKCSTDEIGSIVALQSDCAKKWAWKGAQQSWAKFLFILLNVFVTIGVVYVEEISQPFMVVRFYEHGNTPLISWPKTLMALFPFLSEIFVVLHCKCRQLTCLILWIFRIDKPKALSLLLHTADISHPAKAWDLHHRWTMSLLEEFFRQVKMENCSVFWQHRGSGK